jgi:hypothetical protein
LYDEKKRQHIPGQKQDIEWQPHELEHFLEGMLSTPNTLRFVIFVDALDECDAIDTKEVAFSLHRVSSLAASNNASLDICISTRQFPSITIGNSAEILVHHFKREDMSLFLRSRFDVAAIPSTRIGMLWKSR